MSRDIEPSERTLSDRDQRERAPHPPAHRPERAPLSREERLLRGRTYAHLVSSEQMMTLQEIGAFRTVACRDLAQFRYPGRAQDFRQDLRSLQAQGLIQRRTARASAKGPEFEVVVLTRRGNALLEAHAKPANGQAFYAGFVKPAEVAHDAAIYRMYQAEKTKIERAGGRVRRVVLDYELKRKIYSALGKAQVDKRRSPLEYARAQEEIARQNDLKVVRGKIPLPDLRIEYDTREGERTHVDLELATHHYRGRQVRDKAQAGFKMYAPEDSVSRLAAAFDPELAAAIFSL